MVFSRFGRQICKLYETRPLLMNSLVGGTVYFAGEVTVQLINASEMANFKGRAMKDEISDLLSNGLESLKGKLGLLKSVDLTVATKLGLLGAVENGGVMLTWYNLLSKHVGIGNSTIVVLFKCLLDQIFFATQQDGIFLGVCAVNHSDKLPDAIKELHKNFLTTWINDCSLWPLVNFIGFAYVPLAFQPTYVSMIQFFWQIYISSVASQSANSEHNALADKSDPNEVVDETRILTAFRQIDKDNNGTLDLNELQEAFKLINVSLSKVDLHDMVVNITSTQKLLRPSTNTNIVPVSVKSTKFTDGDLKDEVAISYEDFKYLYEHDRGKFGFIWGALINRISLTKGFKTVLKKLDIVQKEKDASFDKKFSNFNYDRYYEKGEYEVKNIGQIKEIAVKAWKEASEEVTKSESWQKDRNESVKRASLGLSLLFIGAAVRKIIFKI